MMHDNILFWLLICGHLIGDFYAQPPVLVERKKKEVLFLLLHSIIYTFSIFVLLLPIMNWNVFIVFLWISASHFIIDFIKIKLISAKKRFSSLNGKIFFIDQLIHIAIMLLFAYIYASKNIIELNDLGNILLKIYYNLQIKIIPTVFLRFGFVFLLIGKPANVLIKEINKKDNIKKLANTNTETVINEEQNSSEYQNAGKIIGILERILIIIMLVLQQYAAIGLVFTAKSITRYDKISKDPSFAEYYLVGTLLSVLISILSILLIQPI